MLEGIEFLNKEFFWLLLLLPLAVLWYVFKFRKQTAELKISSIKGFKATRSSILPKLKHLLFAMRLAALALLITVPTYLYYTILRLVGYCTCTMVGYCTYVQHC